MSTIEQNVVADVADLLDQLAAAEPVLSNTMFQLALMMARIDVAPSSEADNEEAAQGLMGLVRAKPKSNVVRLFATVPQSGRPEMSRKVMT